VVNVDRPFGALKSRMSGIRLNAVAPRTALALVIGLTGLAAPAAALAAGVAGHEERNAVPIAAAATTVKAAVAGNLPAAPLTKPAAKPAAKPVAKPVAKPATAKAAKPAVKKAAKKPAAPTAKQLHPRGVPGGRQSFKPTKAQLKNAKAIVETGKKMGLPPRAWVIAVATAMQESTLNNFGNLGANNDHDSLGLFQQRPSSGWGTPKQVQNPNYASKAFYQGLVNVPNWNKLPLTDAAQSVQVSAYPNHYAKWERHAGDVVESLYGAGPYAKLAAGLK